MYLYYTNTLNGNCCIYAAANKACIHSNTGLPLVQRHPIIRTNSGSLLIGILWTNICRTLTKISKFLCKKLRKNIVWKLQPIYHSLDQLNVESFSHLTIAYTQIAVSQDTEHTSEYCIVCGWLQYIFHFTLPYGLNTCVRATYFHN